MKRFIRPYLHYLIFVILLAFISVGLTLYAPVIIGEAVDLIPGISMVDFSQIFKLLIKLLIVIIITSLSQWLMTLYTNKIAYKTVRDMRNRVFEKLQEVPLSYIDGIPEGEIISRITTDIEQVSDGLLLGFTHLFTGIVTIIGTIAFMFSINVQITILVIVVTPLSMFVAAFIARYTHRMFKEQSEARGEMTALVDEMISGARVVKAFGYEEESQKRFDEINNRLKICGVRALFYSALTNPTTRFVNGIVYTCVGILGAVMAIKGVISVGQLSCFLNYANQYTKPFNEISGVITEFQSALASAERIFELIDAPAQMPDAADAVELNAADGSVNIKNISFSYRDDVPLIEKLSINVNKGQRIAIVGPTGCGKTTLINLLMRFYDVNKGEITVSNIPIKRITRDSLRTSYGMVLQETWLKEGTIRENIAYARPDAGIEEVIAAAEAAHAHAFIKRLPQGYDTVISGNGDSISQGQKQLLCIARVMLCLPPMLILDEATSSIDTRTEIKIQQAFSEMMVGRTSFIVAHRLSTIREADCILVMKSGNIVEQGTHSELLESGGFYSQIYNSQFEQT